MRRSLLSSLAACLASFSLPRSSFGLGSTDTITWGGDNSRAGYETNHNLDPRIIAGSEFGNIWTAKLPGNFGGIGPEQVLSQPLVYTTGDGVQYVYIATTQNNLYKINAKTGQIVTSRNLGVPFLAADLGNCNDIAPAIGVTGTGVIDPSSGIWYLTSKTYSDQFQGTTFGPRSSPGRANGRYYFHAINTSDLSEALNFPVSIGGTTFRNNPRRQLVAGDQHQRPALLQVGNFIYTGWASHCIQYNYTGAIIGFDKTSGAIVEAFAMEGGPEANSVPGGGVWMSGGGLAYDGGSMYFSTGNGYANQLPANGNPVGGRTPPTALEEAVVNMRVNGDGTIQPVDFFMPWEKTQLDGADKDLGTTPFQLLPSSFSCPNSRRIGMVTGKSGKTYWLNVDNLGGYQMGANRLDAAIQVFQHENSVYSGAGVQPLGGYIYVNVINYKTRVFQFNCNSNGDATFAEVATAAEKNAQALGVGHGTTTSLNGQEGTGLYWTTDVEGLNLRIYDATPPSDGSPLKLIKSFNIDGPGKFAHPVFGDGKAYVAATGALWAFGAPVNLPLNCTSPVTFPRTALNSTSAPITVNCTANVATSVTSFNLTGKPNFVASGLPTLPLTLAAGKSFQFQAKFAPAQVGFLSSDIVVNTTNAAAGSSSRTPVTLTGTASSTVALFNIQPITLSFNTTMGAGAVSKSVFWNNDGDAALNISSVLYSVVSETGPWVTPNTTSDGSSQVAQFTFSNLPSSIDANTRQPVGVVYNPPAAGNHAVFLKVSTSGGTKILDVFGTAGSSPAALFEFERADGSGWDAYVPGQNFSFGNVAPGAVRTLTLRITNNGSSSASPLGLTVSKPPFSVPGYLRASNSIDLAEGTQIAAGQSANATLYCAPPDSQLNTASTAASAAWRINTNNEQGAVILGFVCNGVSPQVGPLFSNGTAMSSYIGCYRDTFNPNRQMASLMYVDNTNNTAGRCINTCSEAGYTFTATIAQTECWCGNALPAMRANEEDCNLRCSGDSSHSCGGNGPEPHDQNMISLFADTTKWDGILQGPPVALPKTSGQYTFAGCYQETNGRTFSAKVQNSVNQTVDNCRDFCAGYPLFGLQYASECYCGSNIARTSTQTTDDSCNFNCKGNNSVVCGGPSLMQVYQLGYDPSSTATASTDVIASATPLPTPLVCPDSAGQTYVSNQETFVVDCGIDYQGGDLQGVGVEPGNLNQCIDACASTRGCSGAVLSGAACYLKSDTSKPVSGGGLAAARMVITPTTSTTTGSTTVGSSTTSDSSTLDASSTATISTVSSSVTPASTPLACPDSNGQTASSNQKTFAVDCGTDYQGGDLKAVGVDANNINHSAIASASLVQGPLKCPDSDGQIYVSNSQTFLVECGRDYPGNDMGSVNINAGDLNACIDACAKTLGCINLSVLGAGCYLKNKLGSSVSSKAILGARIVPAQPSSTASPTSSASASTSLSATSSVTTSVTRSPISSTSSDNLSTISSTTTTSLSASSSTIASSLSATTTLNSQATTTTTTMTTTTSARPTVQATAGIFNSVGCTSEKPNGRALTEIYTNETLMTIDMCAGEAQRRQFNFFGVEYGKECWMGDAVDSEAQPLSQDSCAMVCPGDKTVFCGAGSALQLYQVNSTLITPKLSSPSPLSCSAGDDTVYTASNGARYRIECGWDRRGGSSSMVAAVTYETCLDSCSTTKDCKSVALVDKNCYLKTGTLGTPYRNDQVRGATLVTK
ncbi:hypothetical protein TI39_contig476g00008 [Zymoseptoria brevis]|uniref:WSC domain-containing protein n=1 Tax=Zymoseptoria brevis TaxID=1047168 RepID=A0A0F4GJL4_9PEZI|nr:hypothetical protein TI39_contig476g00008 [Zymoseptoria brevis]